MMSLHGGDLAVADVVACGEPAVRPLRGMLFRREPSGLFQVRCRAVEALASLGAFEVLMEFLAADHLASDPVERLGDDAVVNAAAVALAKTGDERVFRLLSGLARRPCLTGVVAALASYGRRETIPLLVDALEDDAARPVVATALLRFGRHARAALIDCAHRAVPSPVAESESSLRRRRSALALLNGAGVPLRSWPPLRSLIDDGDAKVAVFACKICLKSASPAEHGRAFAKLIDLFAKADWIMQSEIEDCISTYFDKMGFTTGPDIPPRVALGVNGSSDGQMKRSLAELFHRIANKRKAARAGTEAGAERSDT